MDQHCDYYAFISYKREDEKWAKWLQSRIEHYHFPTNLNGRANLPKHIRPVFRDVTDLNPGVLSKEINDALNRSRWLIVICSPRSAQSPWVCKEAKTFIDLGRSDHIIPFVIEGAPFSENPLTECYPQALLYLTGRNELLAANIQEAGRNAAFIRVVSGMFGLRFDSLWQRYKRYVRRRYFMAFLALLSILVASLAVLIGLRKREWKVLENQSSYMAETAIRLANEGDYLLAKRIASANLPSSLAGPRDKPYVPRAEYALWYSFSYDGGVINRDKDISQMAFSPDGRLIVVGKSTDFSIQVLDAESGSRKLPPFLGHTGHIMSLIISPDGKTIASGADDGTIRLWSIDTGECLHVISVSDRITIYSIAFSPDSKRIVSGSSDSIIRVWDAREGIQLMDLSDMEHSATVLSVAFSPDPEGRLIASGGLDYTIRLWDSKTGLPVMPPIECEGGVSRLFFTSDGKRIVSGEGHNMICIRDTETGSLVTKRIIGSEMFYNSKAFCINGPYAAMQGYDDYSIHIMNLETEELFCSPLTGHTSSIEDLLFSRDGRLLASRAEDNTIRIWDLEKNKHYTPLEGHTNAVFSVSFSKDTTLVSGSFDGTVRIWDINSGSNIILPIEMEGYAIQSVSFSPDGALIASGGNDKTVRLWNSKNGLPYLEPLIGHSDIVQSVTFSPDGKFLVSGSEDNTIRIWDLSNSGCRPLPAIEGITTDEKTTIYRGGINSVAFNYDGSLLAYGSFYNVIEILDFKKRTPITKHPLKGHTNSVESVCFSPDGKLLASGSLDCTVCIWNVKTGELVMPPLEGHASSVTSVAFSPDGTRIASGSWDKTVRIWDVKTGELVMPPLEGHTSFVESIAFSPDGKQIASASGDNCIFIWDISTNDLLKRARKNHPALTNEEIAQYLKLSE